MWWIVFRNHENIFGFSIFSRHWNMVLKSFLMEDKDPLISRNKSHDCCWLGDARNQGIISNGIDLVVPGHYGSCTRKVKFQLWQTYHECLKRTRVTRPMAFNIDCSSSCSCFVFIIVTQLITCTLSMSQSHVTIDHWLIVLINGL